MAFPGTLYSSSELTDIIATTIQNRSGELADNITNNNALLMYLKKRGNVKTFSGGDVILQELMYEDSATNNTSSYSGYETLNMTPNSPISASKWDIKQYAAAVSMSGLETLQNSGKEAIIDLIDGRMDVAEAQLMNRISTDVYGDGTGNGGKNITGLQAIVADTNTNTVGGISGTTWTFWRNVVFDSTADGGAASTSANIQSYMNRTALQVVRNMDRPNLVVMDTDYFRKYLESLQAIQRVTDTSDAGAGFQALKYYGAGNIMDVVLDGGMGGNAPSQHAYFLNTKFLFFRPHAKRNFVPIGGDRVPVNQDAVIKYIGWAGNLTCSGRKFQAVIKE